MKTPHKVYISLGSNKGDRLKYLQDATDLIFKNIHLLTKCFRNFSKIITKTFYEKLNKLNKLCYKLKEYPTNK